MFYLQFLFVYLFFEDAVNARLSYDPQNPAFDPNFYKEVLDADLCQKHLDYITSNVQIHLKFVDRGLRLPKAVTEGSMVDLGSYHACLRLKENTGDDVIIGKYCMLKVPLKQDLQLPSLPELPNIPEWPEWPWPWRNITASDRENLAIIEKTQQQLARNRILFDGRTVDGDLSGIDLPDISIKMGMCLPKACTTQEALKRLYFDLSAIDIKYEDEFCRLPDDKPWTPADYVAISLISLVGLVTILSTTYDMNHCIRKKRDPKEANTYLKAFSVYTNTKRILTFNNVPGAIDCIEGLRAFAMAWVILGHTFHAVSSSGSISNLIDVGNWIKSAESLWLMAAPITVDTFFTLSGLLVVYTTAGKMTSMGLLKNLHIFYLNRLLRLFPILAFAVLLQISVFHRVADGPDWNSVANQVNDCRAYWWTNFLYVQNYVNDAGWCLPHSWYLTVDTQLHFISPVVLFWVLSGKKRYAWIGLTAGLIASLTASTVYIFVKKFGLLYTSDAYESQKFMRDYYINTLTRAPPFFVGMIFGYMLHLGRKRKFVINKNLVLLFWAGAASIATSVIYTYYYQANKSDDYNQTVASLINSFTRAAWAVAIGWMILACTHGYGGPINWALCLKELRLLGRVSYSMYIIHYPIMFVYVGTATAPFHFDVLAWIYTFLSHFAASFACGFVITLLVDSPSTVFIKSLLGRGSKKQTSPAKIDTVKVAKHNGYQNERYSQTEKTAF